MASGCWDPAFCFSNFLTFLPRGSLIRSPFPPRNAARLAMSSDSNHRAAHASRPKDEF